MKLDKNCLILFLYGKKMSNSLMLIVSVKTYIKKVYYLFVVPLKQ